MKPLICPEDGKPCTCVDTYPPNPSGCPREQRCAVFKGGLLRCWSKLGHPGEHNFRPSTRSEALAVRPVHLSLTPRLARCVLVLAKRERNRRERDFKKSNFTPEPGRHDANLAAMKMMDDIIQQLEKENVQA